MSKHVRVGADIGGTFTDVVLLFDETIHYCKVSSTPGDYSEGIVLGVSQLLKEVGGEGADIAEIIHATTVATNTVLEGKGAKTALVTTKGFRDVVEIGRQRYPTLYDLTYKKPKPLVARRHRHEVAERILFDGSVLTPIDLSEMRAIANELREANVESVAVCFLHSYANPDHEREAFSILSDVLGPEVYLSKSADVLPEIREYERTSTVVVNAYLGPVVKRYLLSLEERLSHAGIHAPLSIVQSSGGLMSARSAAEIPAAIIESGPAAGVIAAANLGRSVGYSDIITFDMGGTTAKAAMIENGEPTRTTEYEVGAGINLSSRLVKGGGHAVKMPFIDVSEVGAGGGSIVHLDDGGAIQVGPHSAGSNPGPACYDLGGTKPTFTDAAVVLGYLNPRELAGGAVRLNAARSENVLRRQVAAPSGLTLEEAASGVFSIAAVTMMRAVKAVSTYRGRDPREFTLFAFGGNGPLAAVEIARLLEMPRVIIPPSPGVFSALGLLFSKTRREATRTVYQAVSTIDVVSLTQDVDSLHKAVESSLREEGCPSDAMEFTVEAELRYVGQAYELPVPFEIKSEQAGLQSLVEQFHIEHNRTYGHTSPSDPVELVNIRVIGKRRTADDKTFAIPKTRRSGSTTSHRDVFFSEAGKRLLTPIMSRDALSNTLRSGPVIIEEYDSTTVIPPGWNATVDAYSNIVISRET